MTTAGGSSETTYTYEGLTLLSMSTSSQAGTTTITYIHDEAGRPYAALYRSPSATSSVLFGIVTTDRGDVVELVDAEGSPFAAYAYDAYGNPAGMPTQGTGLIGASLAFEIASAQPLRYAGYCFDAFSGLYYLSARYYDPASAQFISKDPARADGEESAYQYCGGEPVGKVDPSGLLSYRERWQQAMRHVNPLERALAHVSLWQAVRVDQARRIARRLTVKYLGNEGPLEWDGERGWHDREGNAFLHAAWSGAMTILMGIRNAKTWGDAHEYGYAAPTLERGPNGWRHFFLARQMDLFNNEIGRRIGDRIRRERSWGWVHWEDSDPPWAGRLGYKVWEACRLGQLRKIRYRARWDGGQWAPTAPGDSPPGQ